MFSTKIMPLHIWQLSSRILTDRTVTRQIQWHWVRSWGNRVVLWTDRHTVKTLPSLEVGNNRLAPQWEILDHASESRITKVYSLSTLKAPKFYELPQFRNAQTNHNGFFTIFTFVTCCKNRSVTRKHSSRVHTTCFLIETPGPGWRPPCTPGPRRRSPWPGQNDRHDAKNWLDLRPLRAVMNGFQRQDCLLPLVPSFWMRLPIPTKKIMLIWLGPSACVEWMQLHGCVPWYTIRDAVIVRDNSF